MKLRFLMIPKEKAYIGTHNLLLLVVVVLHYPLANRN